MKSILYSILWIVAGVALFLSSFYLIACCNLFSWGPQFNSDTILLTLGVITSLVVIAYLARKTIRIPEIIVSLLVCIALTSFGVYAFIALHGQELSSGLLGRRELSPIWFQIMILMIFIFPIITWGYYYRKLRKRANKTNSQDSVPPPEI